MSWIARLLSFRFLNPAARWGYVERPDWLTHLMARIAYASPARRGRARPRRTRLGVLALEDRTVPAHFFVQVADPFGDTAAQHTVNVTVGGGFAAPGWRLVSSSNARAAASSALTHISGTVGVSFMDVSASYPLSGGAGSGYQFSGPGADEPGGTWYLGLEDLAHFPSEFIPDWDYNDRVWPIRVVPWEYPTVGFTVMAGGEGDGTVPAYDPDGNTLGVSYGAAGHGTVSGSGPTFHYVTSSPYYVGEDSFEFTVSDGYGGTDTATVTVTIVPAPLTVSADTPAAEAGPGGAVVPGTYVLTRPAEASLYDLHIPVMSAVETGAGVAEGGDYSLDASGAATLRAGQTTATVTVTPRKDNLVEGTEQILTTFRTGNWWGWWTINGSEQDVTVGLDLYDDPPVVTVEPAGGAAAEFGGDPVPWGWTQHGAFVLKRRGGNTDEPLSVGLVWSGTASRPVDYAVGSWEWNAETQEWEGGYGDPPEDGRMGAGFDAGASERRITFAPYSDLQVEGTETVELAVEGGGDHYLIGYPGSAVVDLLDITVWVDLDVDSDNDDGYDLPSRSWSEDYIEAAEGQPGKVVAANYGDEDGDGVPDLSDGYDLDGVAGTDDDLSPGVRFTPAVLAVSEGVYAGVAWFRFSYPVSVPLPPEEEGEDEGPEVPAFTVWLKDGDEARDGRPLADGGDFVAPDVWYTAEQLGMAWSAEEGNTATLYLEGADASDPDPHLFAVEVAPFGFYPFDDPHEADYDPKTTRTTTGPRAAWCSWPTR